MYKLHAQVDTINGFSAHADRSELIEWARHLKTPPRHTFIVHGEEESSLALANSLQTELGFGNVAVPELGQTFNI